MKKMTKLGLAAMIAVGSVTAIADEAVVVEETAVVADDANTTANLPEGFFEKDSMSCRKFPTEDLSRTEEHGFYC